jgi:uncharacterized cupredoxin-like copper-binding protein
MNPVAPPQADLASRRIPGAANQSVDVQLTEYAIRIEPTLAAGKYTFKIANGGKLDHSFVIDGNSVHAALAEPLKRGDVQTLDVDLSAAGTYEIHCPVDGHAGKGMTVTLTVK